MVPEFHQMVRDVCSKILIPHDAAEEVQRRLNADKVLRRRILNDLIFTACARVVYEYRHNSQRTIKGMDSFRTSAARSGESMGAISDVAALSLLDGWILPNGKCLGDADRLDLRDLVQQEQQIAMGHHHNAKFYDKLLHSLRGKQTIRRVWDEDKLQKLWATISGHRQTKEMLPPKHAVKPKTRKREAAMA